MENLWGVARTRQPPGQSQSDDFYCADPTLGLFAVSSGTGEKGGGWVASRTAIRALRQLVVETRWKYDQAADRLREGLETANNSLEACHREAGERAQAAMSALLCDGTSVAVARLGGCHAFLGRDGVLTELGATSQGEPALDGRERPRIDLIEVESRPGDRWLLCSGGLSQVENRALADVLFRTPADVSRSVHDVIDLAGRAGSRDAVTAIFVACTEFSREVRLIGRADCNAPV